MTFRDSLLPYNQMSSSLRLGTNEENNNIFSVVKDKDEAAASLNQDLERVSLWAWQWKMQFNCDKTEEVIFSVKRPKIEHPTLNLGIMMSRGMTNTSILD